MLDRHLFFTSDAGQTWEEVGPSLPAGALVQDVKFIDDNTGWMLWTTTNSDGSSSFQIAHTLDRGLTWTQQSLSLFEPGEIVSFAGQAEMDWFAPRAGWIVVRQDSSSNFSVGTLFTTSDGGNNWRRFPLPTAGRISFSDPQLGWAAGDPAAGQLFKTIDGGATWQDVWPADMQDAAATVIYPPTASGEQGMLAANAQGEENVLKIYFLDSHSGGWTLQHELKLDSDPGIIGMSMIDAQSFVATIPGTPTLVRMANGRLDLLENQDGLSASIVELDMISRETGWAKSVDASCASVSPRDPQPASVFCSSTTRLLRTEDGGLSWQSVNLPVVAAAFDSSPDESVWSEGLAASAIALPENTEVFIGQGFDKCEIPTLSQMQTWWTSSPYKTVNLYVGGSSRACDNKALTAAYLFQLQQQGWKFIPTWVGPQAPCTGFRSRMSGDAATAYGQGVEEANLAVDRLASLGLTDLNKAGSVVYYDIEHYGTDNLACRTAVNSFMNGWVSQLRARGNLSGVYGSTLCSTGLSDFLSIANVPDLIWAARWYHSQGSGYYDPNASVWNLGSCIPNTAWANHQRIRQYEGGHNETWGSLTLNIDSNVLDGVVAVLHDYPFVTGITRVDPNPTNAAAITFTVTFTQPVTGVDKTDFALTTTGITGAAITSVTGSGARYTVTVSTGKGNGTIRLDLLDNNTIKDAANRPFGGLGSGNGNFTWGEVYDIVFKSWYGSLTIEASQNIVAVARPHVGNQVMAYDGFTSGGSNAYVPMLFKEAFGGTYNSALYIQNVDAVSTANVTIRFYNSSGNETCSQSDTIAPRAAKGYWVPSIPCLPSAWVGGVKVEANRNIVAVGRPHVGTEVLSYNGFTSGSLNAFVPMLFREAFDGTYNSALYIQNVDPAGTAGVTIRFFDSHGSETCSQSDTIAPLASKGYWIPSIACLPSGWVGGVKVEANRNIVAVGRPHVGDQITSYDGFASGSLNMYVPMLFKNAWGAYNAALYIQNVDTAGTANVTIRFYDDNGNETCSQKDTIAPLASKGYWVPSISCLPSGWAGGAKVESDRSIVAVGRPHVGGEILTYNGFSSGSMNVSTPMMFREAFDGTYNSALYIQNVNTGNTASITIRFYDSDGKEVCLLNDSIGPLASKGYWLPSVQCSS